MVIKVNLPDGSSANFPDGTPPETMKAAIQSMYAKKEDKGFLQKTGETIEDFTKSAVTGLAELPLNVAALATDVAGATGGETNAPATDDGLNILGRFSQGLGFLGSVGEDVTSLDLGFKNTREFINNPELRNALLETDTKQLGESIKNSLREVDKIQKETSERSPIASTVGEVGGQIGQLAALPAAGVARGAKGLAGAGTLFGAGFNALETPLEENLTPEQSLEKRQSQFITGGLGGGALGASLPVVVKGIGKYTPIAIEKAKTQVMQVPFINKTVTNMNAKQAAEQLDAKLFDFKALTDKALGGDPVKIISKRLKGRDLGQLQKQLESNTDITLADIAGDEIRGLTRKVGKASGGARNLVHDVLENRANATSDRVLKTINSSVSKVDDYYQNIDDIAKLRAEMSAPLYKKAYEEGADIVDDRLEQFTKDTNVVEAYNYAQKYLGLTQEMKPNSLEALDKVKQALFDKESNLIRNGYNNAARLVGDTRRNLTNVLDEVSPTYSKARKTFGGFAELQNAQELGATYHKLGIPELKQTIKDLTPAQLDAFNIGVRKSLEHQVYNTAQSANEAKKIFGKLLQQKQLKLVLGKNYDQFAKKMNDEINFNETKFNILGGSRTDYNQIDDGLFADTVVEAARGGKLEITRHAIDALANSLTNKYIGINEKNAKVIANILLDNKKGKIFLDRLIKGEKNSLQKMIKKEIADDMQDLL